MQPLKLQIIIASVRPNRSGDKIAAWVADIGRQNPGFEIEIVDLIEWQLPDYNEKGSPNSLKGQLENPMGLKWNDLIAKGDAYVIVTPEYNNGYPASLKNAIDWSYGLKNLMGKPVAFVAYGTVGGARAVQQLRQVVAELGLADIRNGVYITRHWEHFDEGNQIKAGALDVYVEGAKAMFDQLVWWAKALKTARLPAQGEARS